MGFLQDRKDEIEDAVEEDQNDEIDTGFEETEEQKIEEAKQQQEKEEQETETDSESDSEPVADFSSDFDIDTDGGGGGGSSSSGSQSSGSQATPSPSERVRGESNIPSQESLPDTQKELQQVTDFRNQNPILQGAQPVAQQALESREKGLEAREKINRQEEKLRGTEQGTKFETQEGEIVSRSEALNKVQKAEKKINQGLKQQEKKFSEFTEKRQSQGFQEQAATAQQLDRASRETVPLAGQAFNFVSNTGEEVGRVAQGVRDPREAIKNIEAESQLQGVAAMQQGERIRKNVEQGFNQLFSPQVVDERGNQVSTRELSEADREFFQTKGQSRLEEATEAERDFAGTATGSVATLGTMAGGVGIATPGASSTLLRSELDKRQDAVDFEADEAPTVGEAFVGGAGQIESEFTKDPSDFVVEESFEEVGEAAVGLAVAGPAGAAAGAAPTITPSIDASPNIRSTLTNTRKGAVAPGQVDETPEFVRDFGPDTVKQETTGRDISTEQPASVEIETETGAETVTGSSETSLTGSFGAPIVESGPESDIISSAEPSTDIKTEVDSVAEAFAQPQVDAQPRTENIAVPEVVADLRTEVETRPEPKLDPQPEARPEPSLGLGGDDDEVADVFSPLVEDPGAGEEPSAAPSVDAILFGETTDEEVEDDTVFSGFETREITEDFNLF